MANICAELYTTGIDEKDIISGLAGQYKTSTFIPSVKMASEKKRSGTGGGGGLVTGVGCDISR